MKLFYSAQLKKTFMNTDFIQGLSLKKNYNQNIITKYLGILKLLMNKKVLNA